MRNNVRAGSACPITKLALTAALGLALAFTFSCSGDESGGGGGGVYNSGGGSISDDGGNEYYRYYNPYSSTIQRCQDGIVETQCSGEWYNLKTHICVGGRKSHFADVDSTYKIMPLEQYYEQIGVLCEDSYYNTITRQCQGSDVKVKCSNGEWYNPVTQACHTEIIDERYNTTVVDKEKCSGSNSSIAKCLTSKSPYNPETHFCYNGSQVLSKCVGSKYDYETEFCSDINGRVYSKCNGNTYAPSQWCSNGTLKDYEYIIDDRDGKKYNIIEIGEQTWMAENLNYETEDSKCYGDNPANCTKYGRLYDWTSAMAVPYDYYISATCISQFEKYNGICPSGWHIPSEEEWYILRETVVDPNTLRANGWNSDFNGTNDYGFSALPGGYNYENAIVGAFTYHVKDGDFYDVGYVGSWLSYRSQSMSNGVHDCALSWSMGNFPRSPISTLLFIPFDLLVGDFHLWSSVRCVKD